MILVIPPILTAFAIFAWCFRYTELPRKWRGFNFGVSAEELKSLEKRLEGLRLPVSAELVIAGRNILVLVMGVIGIASLVYRQSAGIVLLCMIPLALRLPEILLEKYEKNRKEAILGELPLLIEQVRVYAKACGYYDALKTVTKSPNSALSREMALLSAEMELVGLLEALDNFAKRCNVEEVTSFCKILALETTTGADISEILADYARGARRKKVSKIKQQIKLQPLLMTILPGIMIVLFILMMIIPMIGTIIQQLNAVQ